MKSIILVLAILALPGCYLSHGLGELQPGDVPLDNGGTAGAPAEDDDPDGGMGDGGMAPPVSTLVPILYEVIPNEACSNVDQWLTISGASIDYMGSITITYVSSGATAEIPRGFRDSQDDDVIDWNDLSETTFRTSPDLPWVPAQVHPDSWPSGNYLVYVTNANGNVSNSVGVSLQYCAAGERP